MTSKQTRALAEWSAALADKKLSVLLEEHKDLTDKLSLLSLKLSLLEARMRSVKNKEIEKT